MGKTAKRPCVYLGLQKWMWKYGCGYGKLAALAGLSEPTVSYVLSGRNATKKSIDAILKATGLTYEQAFGKEV